MDNENQITDLVERSKIDFLRDAVRELREQKKLYDLDEEFAKTKKNRNPLVLITVVLVVVLFVGVGVVVRYFTQQSSRNVQINISDFEDVNLKDLLDLSKKNETRLANIRRELATFKEMQASSRLGIQQDAGNRIEILANQSLGNQKRQEEIKKIRDEEKGKIAAVNKEYSGKIQGKEEEIAGIQKEIDEYDSRMLTQARQQEEVLNNQLRLFDIERTNLIDSYDSRIDNLTVMHDRQVKSLEKQKKEVVDLLKSRHASELAQLKNNHVTQLANLEQKHATEIEDTIGLYNPTFTDGRMGLLLGELIDQSLLDTEVAAYRDILDDEGILSERDFQRMNSSLQEFSVVLARLQETPYINSVPGALDQLEYRNRVIVRDYEILWEKLADVVQEKNDVIGERDSTIATRDNSIEQF